MNKKVSFFVFLFLFGYVMLFGAATPAQAKEPPMRYGYCPPNQFQKGLYCKENCRSGYELDGFGVGICYEKCRPGFTNVGLFCTNLDIKAKASYGRGAGVPLWCAPGTQQNGALCYPFCRAGYRGVGPVCWQGCPRGTNRDLGLTCVRWPRIIGWRGWFIFRRPVMDWGWVRWKHSYGRGAGKVLSQCRPGTEKNGALCYPACKSGFKGVGPVCWERCPSGYTDDGAFCRRDNGYARHQYLAKITGFAKTCPNYPKDTKYPIVLVHGLFGFDKLLGFAPYFSHIPECLRAGGATVYTPAVSAGNSTEVRGEQLLAHVRKILKETGKEKVHLIGHSQGGPTSRYVAGVAPELVASVTTVAGVNYGSSFADLMLQMLPDGSGGQILTGVKADAINYLTALLSGKSVFDLPQDSIAATKSLSTAGSEAFNKKFPAGLMGPGKSMPSPVGYVEKDGKRYPMLFFSWTGKAPFGSIGPASVAMSLTHTSVFHPRNSDGLVSVDSAHFGHFLGAYYQDHLAEVNMWLGVQTGFLLTGKAHPVTLFAEHASRLKEYEKVLDDMKPIPVVKKEGEMPPGDSMPN